jgi:phenylacetate-CoA ligase
MSGRHEEYWNPHLETLPREKLVEIELKNFRGLMAYAQEHSPMYARKLEGIEPGDIRSRDDIKRLPLTDKEDLRLAQEGDKPTMFGDLLGVDITEVSCFRQTSGTTGKPVYVPESYESWQWRMEVWCHILWMAGFRPTDRVFIPFGYNVYVAFWEGHYSAEKLGCLVVPGGALDSRGRVNKIREVGANALLNTPTYGLHLAETAREMGLDPRQMGIERMLCAGEPLPRATRLMLETAWGAEVYDHIGGTEPCAWAGMCRERDGLHLMEPFFLVEVLDLETLSREVEAGELGVAVVTPLGRRSFPLVRFNTKDVVRQAGPGCACGRDSRKISQVVGRSDHLTKVRGVLFSPVTVEEVLRGEFPEVVEYELEVKKRGLMDELGLKIECRGELGPDTAREMTGRLGERLKMKTNLRFVIAHVAPGSLPRYTLKHQRFRDLRGEGDHDR